MNAVVQVIGGARLELETALKTTRLVKLPPESLSFVTVVKPDTQREILRSDSLKNVDFHEDGGRESGRELSLC